MRSRVFGNRLGAGARKTSSLWTALFVYSLLLQFIVIAAPVLAVHDTGLFELDGNTANEARLFLATAGTSRPGATGNRYAFHTPTPLDPD